MNYVEGFVAAVPAANKEAYRKHAAEAAPLFKEYGVKTVTNELPDYLPLILEFVAHLDESEATVFLSDAGKVLSMLADNLAKAESPYAAPLSIIKTRATLTRLAA